ncbi:MAG: hypothetical protein C4343_06455, partial [Chloroflexota bacterium]
ARADLTEAHLPAVTRDGVEVTLLANIGTPDESARAVALGAHGVGLFRTEFLFIERPEPPSEAEQLAAYRAVLEAFAPHSVTIRLLDIGGDKPIPYLPLEPEANPFLGVRAIRLAVARPELFVTQLRASMRAAVGAVGPDGRPRVKVMAPMVADATDVDLLLELAERAAGGLRAEGLEAGPIDLGAMLEIPSAILVGPTYFGRLAFASIGTNDLTQYTLAVDRGNRALGRYQDPLHPGGRDRALGLRRDGRRRGRGARPRRPRDPEAEHGLGQPPGGAPGDPGEFPRAPRGGGKGCPKAADRGGGPGTVRGARSGPLMGLRREGRLRPFLWGLGSCVGPLFAHLDASRPCRPLSGAPSRS